MLDRIQPCRECARFGYAICVTSQGTHRPEDLPIPCCLKMLETEIARDALRTWIWINYRHCLSYPDALSIPDSTLSIRILIARVRLHFPLYPAYLYLSDPVFLPSSIELGAAKAVSQIAASVKKNPQSNNDLLLHLALTSLSDYIRPSFGIISSVPCCVCIVRTCKRPRRYPSLSPHYLRSHLG